jgi:hypothetical protein
MNKKPKIKRIKKQEKFILDLVPLVYKLAISAIGMDITLKGLFELEALEIQKRLQEFKLMNVIEIEFKDKNMKEIEYRELDKIDKFTKSFLKNNPKWIYEKEVIADIETGRYIFKRVYRNYHKKYKDEEEYCECCRSLLK